MRLLHAKIAIIYIVAIGMTIWAGWLALALGEDTLGVVEAESIMVLLMWPLAVLTETNLRVVNEALHS